MRNFEKFKEQLSSSLTGKKISNKEYKHVLKIWNKFEMKTIKHYDDFYLKFDALLIANVFE